MKCFLTLLALALFALTFWMYRRRVGRAIKVATYGYLALILINVYRFADDEQSLVNVGLLIAGSLALWGAAWLVVNAIAKRRESERAGARPPSNSGSRGFKP